MHPVTPLVLTLLLACLGLTACATAPTFEPRHDYGAKLEPVAHVLHGAGQSRVDDVLQYEAAIAPHRPVIFMDYFNLKGNPAVFADRLRQKLAALDHFAAVQLGLSMTSDGRPSTHYEHEVAQGLHDANLHALFAALRDLNVPIYLRIGYECNGPWNGYVAESYVQAFRHVTTILRTYDAPIATVWCPHPSTLALAMPYYPGDEWVDWWAVDLFGAHEIPASRPLLSLAHKHGKPVMIGESTPHTVGVLSGRASWDAWFAPYFQLIRDHPNIKAFCYINWDWSPFPQWQNWGDARLQQNPVVADLYRREMASPLYLHGSTKDDFLRALGNRP